MDRSRAILAFIWINEHTTQALLAHTYQLNGTTPHLLSRAPATALGGTELGTWPLERPVPTIPTDLATLHYYDLWSFCLLQALITPKPPLQVDSLTPCDNKQPVSDFPSTVGVVCIPSRSTLVCASRAKVDASLLDAHSWLDLQKGIVVGHKNPLALELSSSDSSPSLFSSQALHSNQPSPPVPMDSFTTIASFTNQPSVEVPSDLETGGGSGNGAYCVIA
ncbi:fungal mating-type domain-containing protein-containing protein [Coprinopsis cinerea okayama7|uniref:Fungal mating-type domain-containing protein-containing protein n=2 Tax=Coprinopsis cinerea (strain Okayama-7 / 130 / ATCC MYA-4618 / FGSC 9003) TaxID=240176 RepID=A8NVL4_COPC7|nr:fungal mating-type domain-containing protein-containing protein [Coprinopsis cinerea okayama7\|eukprot:XP_001836678.1 fungal mating-type domain-containing protein-containing protein [Coprinopsis cinerea okayama7\